MLRYLLPIGLLLTQELVPREGKAHDQGQVHPPAEGMVETLPEGQVEPVNPTVVEEPRRLPQQDLFQFESRSFEPVPNPQ